MFIRQVAVLKLRCVSLSETILMPKQEILKTYRTASSGLLIVVNLNCDQLR